MASSSLDDRLFSVCRGEHASLIEKAKNINDLRSPGQRGVAIYTYEEMKVATYSFRFVLGRGGFGVVYERFVGDNVRVAIKERYMGSVQGDLEWLAEVNYLGQLRYPNLVKLIGYCCEDEHKLLVYEYMASDSLDKHLFSEVWPIVTLLNRMKIALDVALGLAFLHRADRPIIYMDFKTANILLDADWNAKLSDFGLAKDGPVGDQTHV